MDQLGRKHHCGGCDATYFDFNKPGFPCPRCGKPPAPRVGPEPRRRRRSSLVPPNGLLDSVIDDDCELLGEDSLEGAGIKTGGVAPPPHLLKLGSS